MPQGNVGTPLSTFMTLIRTCKLPGHVIKKLQLEFPKSRSSKRYGAVKFDYGEARGKGNMEGGDGEEEEEEDSDLIDKGVASEDNRRDGDDYVEDERSPSVCNVTFLSQLSHIVWFSTWHFLSQLWIAS